MKHFKEFLIYWWKYKFQQTQSSLEETLIITLVGSLMLPRPLIRTRHSVLASTLLREFPLGPRRRPTKLYCKKKSTSNTAEKKNHEQAHRREKVYTNIRIFFDRDIHSEGSFDNKTRWAALRTQPVLCWWRLYQTRNLHIIIPDSLKLTNR